jgi:hypothetical protein
MVFFSFLLWVIWAHIRQRPVHLCKLVTVKPEPPGVYREVAKLIAEVVPITIVYGALPL